MTLYPVIIEVPHDENEPPLQRMKKQRGYARRALRRCAELSGAPSNGWSQQKGGAPIPNGKFYWSISHTRGLAAAVVAMQPVGIDVERIRERRVDLFDEVGRGEEWSLLGGRTWFAFFYLWTAKEAVLKANSLGIGHLDQCRLIEPDRNARSFNKGDPLVSSLLNHPTRSDAQDQRRSESAMVDAFSPCASKLVFYDATWLVWHRMMTTDFIAAVATRNPTPIEWTRVF